MGSPEFHTQSTSDQNTLRSLLAGGFTRIPHPINFQPNNNKHRLSPEFIKPKFTNPTRDSHTHGWKFTTQPIHTQPKLLMPLQRTHQIGQLRKNPQKISFRRKSPFNRWTMTRDPQSAPLLDGNRRFCLPEKIGSFPRSTHLSQISFSPILLLPSSSNPKRGSGGHAGLKERDCRWEVSERERGWSGELVRERKKI